MSSVTPNYGFILPSVNDPTDQDLWGGMLNSNFTLLDGLLPTISQVPVGSLYFNADVATDPATLLGYGTWVAFGAGRVIVGVGTGTDANGNMMNFTAGLSGGEYTHTLTTPEMPSHTHGPLTGNELMSRSPLGSGGQLAQYSAGTPDHNEFFNSTTSSTGGGGAHNNIQPYITVYVWKRSA